MYNTPFALLKQTSFKGQNAKKEYGEYNAKYLTATA